MSEDSKEPADPGSVASHCSSVKLVFLDVDGVLVNRRSLMVRSGLNAKADPPCVAALNRVIAETGAKIVVSSTWRMAGDSRIKRHLKSWGVMGRVVGCTPVMRHLNRGGEIQAFMDAWSSPKQIGAIVIIDDDRDMDHLSDRLVRTEFEVGFTEADADRAIAMLGRY